MGKRPRDTGRQKVYDAEHALPGIDKTEFTCLWDIHDFIDSVTHTDWFRTRWPHVTYIEVRLPRKGRRAWAQPNDVGGRISLPPWARNRQVILHELAHLLTDRESPWHGAEFISIYIELTRRYHCAEVAKSLVTNLHRQKVLIPA